MVHELETIRGTYAQVYSKYDYANINLMIKTKFHLQITNDRIERTYNEIAQTQTMFIGIGKGKKPLIELMYCDVNTFYRQVERSNTFVCSIFCQTRLCAWGLRHPEHVAARA